MEAYIDPITLCPMDDPVCAADGHLYGYKSLSQWMARTGGNQVKSPRTGANMGRTLFRSFDVHKTFYAHADAHRWKYTRRTEFGVVQPYTSMVALIKSNNCTKIYELLDAGEVPSAEDLVEAVGNNRYEMVQRFVAAGVDLTDGSWLARTHDLAMTEYLFKAGAKVAPSQLTAAMASAVAECRAPHMLMLMEHGVDIHSLPLSVLTDFIKDDSNNFIDTAGILEILVEFGMDTRRDDDALIKAAATAKTHGLLYLLTRGPSVYTLPADIFTHYCTRGNMCYTEILCLLMAGADPAPVLAYYACRGHEKVVYMLIKAGAVVTPEVRACAKGEVVRLLACMSDGLV